MRTALAILLSIFSLGIAAADAREPTKWVEHPEAIFTTERQANGDSFAMEMLTKKGNKILRAYRLYGTDCPESDPTDIMLQSRILEQAMHFGVTQKEVVVLGKEAADFTVKWMKIGHPRIFTYGPYGERVPKLPGRPQRYYALVEVTGPDGKPRWLHELLLQAGYSCVFGKSAPWPEKDLARHGETEARERFQKDLIRLESAARRAHLGAWKSIATLPP